MNKMIRRSDTKTSRLKGLRKSSDHEHKRKKFFSRKTVSLREEGWLHFLNKIHGVSVKCISFFFADGRGALLHVSPYHSKPFVVEEVTVHNIDASTLDKLTSVWVLLSPLLERQETRPTVTPLSTDGERRLAKVQLSTRPGIEPGIF